MAGVSEFGYLSSGAVPGSSHAIGACAPFTVWAVVPFSRGGSIIIIITRTASSYAGVQANRLDPYCFCKDFYYYTYPPETMPTPQTVNGADAGIA